MTLHLYMLVPDSKMLVLIRSAVNNFLIVSKYLLLYNNLHEYTYYYIITYLLLFIFTFEEFVKIKFSIANNIYTL